MSLSTQFPALSRYAVDIKTGCHTFLGAHHSQDNAYAEVWDTANRRPIAAHRAAWIAANGPIPETPCADGSDRYEIHHRCGSKSCINPDHLKLVSRREHAAIHKAERAAAKRLKAA